VEFSSTIQDSAAKDLFYSLYIYLVMSAICGRVGWYDINKRLQELMQHLLRNYSYLQDDLEKILANWPDKDLFVLTRMSPNVTDWVSEFLEELQY
jgi:hypothetical protein